MKTRYLTIPRKSASSLRRVITPVTRPWAWDALSLMAYTVLVLAPILGLMAYLFPLT
jgi:hypothetical protein